MQQEASLKRAYLRQVKKHLTCSPKERNRFLHRTEQMLDAFLEENPDATEEDLYLALGSPEELAEQMMEECDKEQIKLFSSKRVLKVSTASIILGIVLVSVFVLAYQRRSIHVYTEVHPLQYIYFMDNSNTSLPHFSVIFSDEEG